MTVRGSLQRQARFQMSGNLDFQRTQNNSPKVLSFGMKALVLGTWEVQQAMQAPQGHKQLRLRASQPKYIYIYIYIRIYIYIYIMYIHISQ